MSAHWSMKRSIPILAAVVLLCASGARAETIPPDSWIYGALRSFELRGLVALEPTLPYTRARIEEYVAAIAEAVRAGDVALGARQRFLLERLEEEFVGTIGRPEDREDRPLSTLRDGGRFAAIDAAVGCAGLKRIDREKGEANGLGAVGMLVGLGRGITMETGYRIVMAPEWGSNADGEKPSPRTRSFRGLSGEFERGIVAADGDWWEVRFGRDYLHWGGGAEEGLLLSRTAGSLDHFGARIELGRFALSTFESVLHQQSGWIDSRYLAGHRLTVSLPRGIFVGVGETVLYGSRDLSWVYLMPLSIFYVNQVNERTNNDNILYSFDVKAPLARGIVLTGEVLVDDIQYERGEGAGPDRLALTIGVDGQLVAGGRDFGFSGRYTYVDIYTYERGYTRQLFDANTSYVAGNGSYPTNPLIGSTIGPDADRWDVAISCGAGARLDLRLDASFIRCGEGNDMRAWYPGRDNDPPFPSGEVLREKWLSAACSYDFGRGSYVSGRGGVRFLDGGPDGLDREDGFARLELVLDL